MSSKRYIAFSLRILFLLALLFFGLVAGIYFFLPHYLESRFLPFLMAETEISDIAFKVRRVGFFGADLGEVRIGSKPNPALVIRSVQLDYSPGELYRKKIERAVLNGIEIHGQWENGKFSLNEIDPQKVLSNLLSRPKLQSVSGPTSPPVLANRLEMRNAALVIKINERPYRIPFEIEITPDNSEYTLFTVGAWLYPRGQTIGCQGKFDLSRRRIRMKAEISALNLGRFSDIIQLGGNISASGRVNMIATSEFQFAPFQISSLNAAIEWQAFEFMINNLRIHTIDSTSLETRLAGRYDRDGNWKLRVDSNDDQKASAKIVRFRVDQYEVSSKIPQIDISGRKEQDRMTAAFNIILAEALMDSGSETMRVPKAIIKGTADLAAGDRIPSTANIEIQAPGTSLASAAGRVTMGNVSLTGKINKTTRNTAGFDGLLRFGRGRMSLSDINSRMEGISGAIPLIWPPKRHQKKGRISIASLSYRKLSLGAIQGQIHQTATGFNVNGRLRGDLLPHTSLMFEGRSRIFDTKRPSARINFNLMRPFGVPDFDLSNYHSAAQDIKINGKILLSATFLMEDSKFSGSIQSQMINGKVGKTKQQFAIEGIQISLSIPGLPEVRSAPGQQLKFSKLSYGDLTAENGIIDFQIESPRSFLIEKVHFDWSGGKVDTQAMRISRGREDYHIIFYCDRLNLAKVLEQFGAAAAEGNGTVSGRIPIRYTNGKLSFDDGFLFSTPGAGGKINLTGTEILTAGIPPDTPQFFQMELAREALKDYDYTWAKLSLNSEGENLLLKMQMDGKPAKTLPFVYRKDVGGFIRVEAGGEGSRFQGIRLDVNFRLPLNKLLQYQGLIKMIQ